MLKKTLVLFLISLCAFVKVEAQSLAELRFDIGAPSIVDYYVDPMNGRDSNSGRSANEAYKTLTQAWNSIPLAAPLSTGFRINILPGTLPESALPNYLESRHGTYGAPIIIRAANGRGSVTLGGDLNVFDTRYLYLIDLIINPTPAGDAFHCEKCDHILIRNSELSGGTRQAHETIKINQSQFIYIEDSNIHGADDNAIDFVAVQYGHVARNTIHNAQDWCIYAKGGSAYIRIEGNEIYNCGTGGFTAGQGTGFEFMTAPWIHYEAYDLKVINNVIHDTEGAGLGVNGGYNILLAHNTLYRTGSRSHMVEVVYGLRSCDGNATLCQANLNAGGWGTAIPGGDSVAHIGNQNVFIYNNVFYNPPGFASGQHFAVYSPRAALPGSNVPGPVVTDTNLQIKGNYIYNNPSGSVLGIDGDSGCQNSNPTCTVGQILAQNVINISEPQLVNPVSGDFRPTETSNLFSALTFGISSFLGGDRVAVPLAPEGNLLNEVTRDRGESTRTSTVPPGAYASSTSVIVPPGGGGGGGGGNDSSDKPPVISKTSCTPKKLKIRAGQKKTVACTVTARDDKKLSKISLQVGKATSRLKKSGKIYKGSIAFKKRGTFIIMVLATDSAGQTTVKSGGKIKVTK